MFMMHRKLMASGAELAAKKAMGNRERGRGDSPSHPPPKKVGLPKSRILVRLAGIEVIGKYDDIMGDLEYRERKGDFTKARKGLTFT